MPFVVFCSATVFCARKMLRIFLIGRKKPSVTAGTLGEIGFEIFFVNNLWFNYFSSKKLKIVKNRVIW
jgi:hypothetical protein